MGTELTEKVDLSALELFKGYGSATKIAKAMPKFEQQFNYSQMLGAIRNGLKSREWRIDEIENQVAMAKTVEKALKIGDIRVETVENTKKYVVSNLETEFLAPPAVDRWRQLADIPWQDRKTYYEETTLPTRNGLLNWWAKKFISGTVKEVDGEYSVIVIDPPWPMEKIQRDSVPGEIQDSMEYPIMSEEELEAVQIPAAGDCHLFLWTTHKFLPMALRLCEAWGFRYVCTFVWHKPGGFQPIGLPQYNCEFVLYCRKGSPKFHTTKAFFTCFEAPRGAHSEKPEAFYDTVKRVTRGKRIDMFNRREIPGFDTWGNESE